MNGNGVAAMTPQERLQARLADPRTVETVNQVLDRLELIAFSVEALDTFIGRSQVVVDSMADGVAELRHLAPPAGTAEIVGKLPQLARAGAQLADTTATPAFQNLLASGLLEQVGQPATIDALRRLIDKLDLAVFALEAADGFLARGEEVTDSVAGGVVELRRFSPGVDLAKVKRLLDALPVLIDTGNQLIDSGLPAKMQQLADAGVQLADAGMFDARTIGVLVEAGKAVADSYDQVKAAPRKSIGPLGLLRALGDPELQATLQFLLEVGRRYGRSIK